MYDDEQAGGGEGLTISFLLTLRKASRLNQEAFLFYTNERKKKCFTTDSKTKIDLKRKYKFN